MDPGWLLVTRGLVRLAAWTVGWMLYEWWAVIGWPATLDEDHFVLMIACAGSSMGLTVWYAVGRIGAALPYRSPAG
jgi:hypothetical protein